MCQTVLLMIFLYCILFMVTGGGGFLISSKIFHNFSCEPYRHLDLGPLVSGTRFEPVKSAHDAPSSPVSHQPIFFGDPYSKVGWGGIRNTWPLNIVLLRSPVCYQPIFWGEPYSTEDTVGGRGGVSRGL